MPTMTHRGVTYYAQYPGAGSHYSAHDKGCLCEHHCIPAYHSHNAINECICEDCRNVRQKLAYVESANSSPGTILTVRIPEAMSAIVICDRCGAFATAKALGNLAELPAIGMTVTDHEICPQCVQEFKDWWVNPGERTGKAYNQPWTPPVEDTVEAAKLRDMVRMIAGEMVKAHRELESGPAVINADD